MTDKPDEGYEPLVTLKWANERCDELRAENEGLRSAYEIMRNVADNRNADNIMDVNIPNMDPETWQAIKSEAVWRGVTIAELLAVLWREYALQHVVSRR